MLFKLPIILLAAVGCLVQPIVANPVAQDKLLSNNTASDVGSIHWHGEIFPGKGMIELVGRDVQDIEDQIVKINPMFMNQLVAAETTKWDPNSHVPVLYCGTMSTGDGNTGYKLIYPYNRHVFQELTVTPPRKCIRHSCKDTTGIYICNDSDNSIAMYKHIMFDFAKVILQKCCSMDFYHLPPISGQAFLDIAKMNIIVSYANCNHAADADYPPNFLFPGPNGECCKECRNDRNGNPYVGGWGHDGL